MKKLMKTPGSADDTENTVKGKASPLFSAGEKILYGFQTVDFFVRLEYADAVARGANAEMVRNY